MYIIEGILFGLTLTILLGPIFIVLVQSSIERGARAGLIAASGIWTSDIMIVGISLFFIKRISSYVSSQEFIFWVGIVGGIVLIVVGMVTIGRKAQISFESKKISASTIFDYWTRGFLVNTINPFTFIFWLSVISTFVASRNLSNKETISFLGAILATIIITDTIKVLLAKLIRVRINNYVLSLINKVAGAALIIFGFILIIKSVI